MNVQEFCDTPFVEITPGLTTVTEEGFEITLAGTLGILLVRGALKQVVLLRLHGVITREQMAGMRKIIEANKTGVPNGGSLDLGLQRCSCGEHSYLCWLGETVASVWSHEHLVVVVGQLREGEYVSQERITAFLTGPQEPVAEPAEPQETAPNAELEQPTEPPEPVAEPATPLPSGN